jgi:hypothetical protein
MSIRFNSNVEALSPQERLLLDENPDVQLDRARQILKGVGIYTRQIEQNERWLPLPDAGKVARAE